MMRKRALTADEAEAWSRVVAGVKPIGARDRDLKRMIEALVPAGAEKPETPAVLKRVPEQKMSPEKRVTKIKEPADRGSEKRVRRGRVDLARRIDLHGHTQASAARVVSDFVASARADGERTVLVITGKGRSGTSVIRRNFIDWLSSPEGAANVSGYAEAHAKHGGAGAFYVFLRKV
jgi:DNA-nicking Smr family endonuclease